MGAEALNNELSNLEGHRRLVSEGLIELRQLRAHAERIGAAEVTARLSEVIRRLEEDVFRVAVVGEFKRGKSTLINALLGAEILPADVLPCSATLNRVTYGLKPSVRLVFRPDAQGQRREEVIGADQLSDYVTKLTPESEQRAADIEEAVVYHPLRYCRDKADIIDTPGLNDDAAMTAVTLQVLPQVDAALFVILAQSPFSGYEGEFLHRLLSHDLGRVIFVVNRMDEIRRDKDRERILKVVEERIEKAVRARAAELHGEGSPAYQEMLLRAGRPRVYGVSGALALEGKLEGEVEALQKSGFPAFEEALERFLVEERGRVTLLIMADAAISAARKLQVEARLRSGAMAMKAGEFESAWVDTTRRLEDLRHQLDGELLRLEEASRELRTRLRPRARALAPALLEAAGRAIDAWPLSAEDISGKKAEQTAERMGRAVMDQVQSAARKESEQIQLEIEAGLQAEVARLIDFRGRLETELNAVQLTFRPDPQDPDPGIALTAGAGMISSALGGWLVGGVLGGAFTGYQLAGFRGAATGAAVGAAAGFGAATAGGVIIAMLGLPLTWPVLLPTLALAGLASAFGARWFTRAIFGGEAVDRFRERFREAVLSQLEASSAQRVAEVERATEHQVTEAFGALRRQVENELGGLILQTQRTLDDLRAHRSRSEAQREHETSSLSEMSEQAARIEARQLRIAEGLRGQEAQP